MIGASARRIAIVTVNLTFPRRMARFHGQISARYRVQTLLAVPPLTHRISRAGPERGAQKIGFYISRRDSFPQISLNIQRQKEAAVKTELIKNSSDTLQTLFSGNNALWHLLGALWNIYRSNNLQLSQSFLSLLHSASERRINLSAWVSSSRVLQTLARSQITQTRKLSGVLFYESRTQRHTFNKIESELSRQLLILRDRMPPRFFSKFQHFAKIFNVNSLPPGRIFMPGPIELRTRTKYGTALNIIRRTDFHRESRILDRLSLLSRYTGRDWETRTFRSALFTRAWLVPVLYRLYEEMEANTMFYSASSYQSARTLYRLTNSLWKVYNNQNLELSRSFTRLINTVTEKNTELKIAKHHSGMFSTTRSLGNLVSALRNAFSGNNLSLRNSLVSLISDINEAGASQRKHYNSTSHTLNFRSIEAPRVASYNTFILHKSSGVSKSDTHNNTLARDVERLLDEKLKDLSAASPAQSKDAESLYRYFADRIKREQRQDWRFEKLQRGLF